jgi:DNA-binding NarL/FixJ family response regulator
MTDSGYVVFPKPTAPSAAIMDADHRLHINRLLKEISRTTRDLGKNLPSNGKRIVIVDDHPLIRRGLERMIQCTDGFVVCGEAGNASEGMAAVRKLKPDLAIVDVSLPGEDGIALTKQLVREFPRLPVLILSMHDESVYALRAVRVGAMGYMVKHEAVKKIGSALRQLLDGRLYLSPCIAAQLASDRALNKSTAWRMPSSKSAATGRRRQAKRPIERGAVLSEAFARAT